MPGSDYSAPRARLELAHVEPLAIGWKPASTDSSPWIEVDLGFDHILSAVVLQGGYSISPGTQERTPSWVSKFSLQTSVDGLTWDVYAAAEIAGASDADTAVKRDLYTQAVEPLRARFVRILPRQCSYAVVDNRASSASRGMGKSQVASASLSCAMRFDLLGHGLCGDRAGAAAAAGVQCPSAGALGISGAAMTGGSSVLPDSAFSASSSESSLHAPFAARLNSIGRAFKEGGWSPSCAGGSAVHPCRPPTALGEPAAAATSNSTAAAAAAPISEVVADYLQIDLGRELEVNAVATQGAESRPAWVSQYQLAFSNDGIHYVSGGKYNGNADNSQIVKNTLSRPVIARFVRILPISWSSGSGAGGEAAGDYGLRAELYGPEGYRPGESSCRLQQAAGTPGAGCFCPGAAAAAAAAGGAVVAPHGSPADIGQGAAAALQLVPSCPCSVNHRGGNAASQPFITSSTTTTGTGAVLRGSAVHHQQVTSTVVVPEAIVAAAVAAPEQKKGL